MKIHMLEVGLAPAQEPSVALHHPTRLRRQLLEANVFRRMMSRLFPVPTGLRAFFLVTMRQDGDDTFYNVALSYDSDHPAGERFARRVELEIPQLWDLQARCELTWFERSLGYYQALIDGSIQEADIPQFYRGVTPPTATDIMLMELRASRWGTEVAHAYS